MYTKETRLCLYTCFSLKSYVLAKNRVNGCGRVPHNFHVSGYLCMIAFLSRHSFDINQQYVNACLNVYLIDMYLNCQSYNLKYITS